MIILLRLFELDRRQMSGSFPWNISFEVSLVWHNRSASYDEISFDVIEEPQFYFDLKHTSIG